MTKNKERMKQLTKKWLLEYFEDGEVRMPSDLDEDFFGAVDAIGVFSGDFMWNKTIFFHSLGDLVKEGNIKYWRNEEGDHCYRKASGGDWQA